MEYFVQTRGKGHRSLWRDMDETIAFYQILNLKNGFRYVGSSVRVGVRLRRHLKELREGKHHCPRFQRAWRKNQEDSFCFVILKIFESEERVREAEQSVLDSREFLYNTSFRATGGDIISTHPDREAIRKKIVETTVRNNSLRTKEERQQIYGKPGELNGMYGGGASYSPVGKKAMSLNGKRLGKTLKGVAKSPEHRAKISENAKGRTGSKNPFYGKRHSDEAKSAIREKNLGKASENAIPVRIDGVEYPSKAAAARALGVAPATILWRMKSKNPRFAGYQELRSRENLGTIHL